MSQRQVILCDADGRPIGTAELFAAHTGNGQLHLAFSVYVFSEDGQRLLIQQRSAEKMLWPLVWANTCCSHPKADETPIEAGHRRLREELSIVCDLQHGPAFVYRAEDPNGRGVEHEYDICLIGMSSLDPTPNLSEVAAWRWVDVATLLREMREAPDRFAPWLHLGFPLVLEWVKATPLRSSS